MEGLLIWFHNTHSAPRKNPTVKHQFHEIILSGTVLSFSLTTAVSTNQNSSNRSQLKKTPGDSVLPLHGSAVSCLFLTCKRTWAFMRKSLPRLSMRKSSNFGWAGRIRIYRNLHLSGHQDPWCFEMMGHDRSMLRHQGWALRALLPAIKSSWIQFITHEHLHCKILMRLLFANDCKCIFHHISHIPKPTHSRTRTRI